MPPKTPRAPTNPLPPRVTAAMEAITVAYQGRPHGSSLLLAINRFAGALMLWMAGADTAPSRIATDGPALVALIRAEPNSSLARQLEESLADLGLT